MADKQEIIRTILELAQKNYEQVGDPDEFGIDFMARDKTHTLKITQSGVNFTSTTDVNRFYAFGFKHMPEIRRMLTHAPSFEQPIDPPVRSSSKPGKPESSSGPSARGLIFGMLDQHKDSPPADLQEQILASLVKQFPERDPKKLKAQIYLHRSEWNKKQKAQ